jgi:uncharacterized protein
MKVFVDTGGWAALYNAHDDRHEDAKRAWGLLAKARARLFTSNYVLSETITLLGARAGHAAGLRFGSDLFASRLVTRCRVDEPVERRAWDIYCQYSDHEFSFVDCTSFALMRALSLTQALTFDSDFSLFGIERLPAL